MYGISGIWHSYKESSYELVNKAKMMSDMLVHRGPDDNGYWINEWYK